MGIHSRNKGKSGEREVRDLFRTAFKGYMPDTDVIRRNHQQAEIGGADLVNVPYLSVEVKRVKQIGWGKILKDWWEQTVEQSIGGENKSPCLVFRQDFGKWFVMFYASPMIASEYREFHTDFMYPVIMVWKEFETFLHDSMEKTGD